MRVLDWLTVLFWVEEKWGRVVLALLVAGLLYPSVVSITAAVTVTDISLYANKLCRYWADQRDPPVKQIISPAVVPLHPFVPR